MATRIYLPSSSGTTTISPTVDAGWDLSAGAFDRITAVTTKSSTAMTNTNRGDTGVHNVPTHYCNRQYIYGPVGAQTITGTVKGQAYCSESNLDTEAMYAIVIRVIASDGTTVRGTLLSALPGALSSEYTGTAANTSETNRNFPPSTAVSSTAAQNGDFIVIEYGHAVFKSGGTERFCRTYFGDDQGTDAPEDETDTNRTARNPWLEFSFNIAGASSSSSVAPLMFQVF